MMMGGGGGQESVNQKFTLHFYSYTARIKVILTQKRVCGTAYTEENAQFTLQSAVQNLNDVPIHSRNIKYNYIPHL